MNNHIYLQLTSLNKTHNNHYLKRYVKLISFFKERNLKKKKFLHNEHHIIPESFGGPDTNENLVCITLREHFILHHLLYKAFPKSQMTIAFFAMCSGWGHMDFKVTSKGYEKLKIEFAERQSETIRQIQNKLVAEGKHYWQDKEKSSQRARKQVADGKNALCGDGELQRKNNLKRVAEGTHHFSGGEIQKKLVAEGKHHLLGLENSKKQLENGTHPSQIKKLCEHCNKEFSLGPFSNFHGDKCKLNPLFKDDKPKIECPHCNRFFSKSMFTQWHGDKCKLNPFRENKISNSNPKILCEHCNKEFSSNMFSRWHGDKCKLKPM